jgi:hypothetical protein
MNNEVIIAPMTEAEIKEDMEFFRRTKCTSYELFAELCAIKEDSGISRKEARYQVEHDIFMLSCKKWENLRNNLVSFTND